MDLLEFTQMRRDRHTRGIEDDKPGARRSLVDGAYEALLEVIQTMLLILNQRTIAVMGVGFVNDRLVTALQRHGLEEL